METPTKMNEKTDLALQVDSDSDAASNSKSYEDEIEMLNAMDPPKVGVTSMKVLFYVPNLIDYVRYMLVFQGMKYAFVQEKWRNFMFFYYVAIAMDVIDGAFARILDQTSRYGQCLDMICDRASVSMMYLVLSQVYPILEMPLIGFFLLDFGAHFLQFMANATTKNTSHKNVDDPNENWIVKLYYGNKIFFVIMACGADNGLVYAFMNGRYTEIQNSLKYNIILAIFTTIICMKQFINVGQWVGSVKKLRNYDAAQKIKRQQERLAKRQAFKLRKDQESKTNPKCAI